MIGTDAVFMVAVGACGFMAVVGAVSGGDKMVSGFMVGVRAVSRAKKDGEEETRAVDDSARPVEGKHWAAVTHGKVY